MYAGFLLSIRPENGDIKRWAWFIFDDDGRIREGIFPTLKATYARISELMQKNPQRGTGLEESLQCVYRYKQISPEEEYSVIGPILEGPFTYEKDGAFFECSR